MKTVLLAERVNPKNGAKETARANILLSPFNPFSIWHQRFTPA